MMRVRATLYLHEAFAPVLPFCRQLGTDADSKLNAKYCEEAGVALQTKTTHISCGR